MLQQQLLIGQYQVQKIHRSLHQVLPRVAEVDLERIR